MECTFFGHIVNRVNFQDAGICPVRTIKLKASSIAIKYSSGATFNNSAVRPPSSDALLIFNRLIACIGSAHVHGGSNIDGKFDACAGGPTNNASSIEANSCTAGCCADRRPDGRGKFSRNVFQHETYFNKVAKCQDLHRRSSRRCKLSNLQAQGFASDLCLRMRPKWLNVFNSVDGLKLPPEF